MKRSRVNPISKRRREESKIRNSQWEDFREEHPNCEILSRVCTGFTQCRHHLKGRVGSLFLDQRYQKASCNACNLFLETYEGKVWGKANGFILDRLKIN